MRNYLFIAIAVAVVALGVIYYSLFIQTPVSHDTVLPRMEETATPQTGANFPSPTNYVVDTTGKLSQGTVDSLNNELKQFDSKAQIAVVLVSTTSPESLEDYSIHLADRWKVGYAGLDNGVILLVAVNDKKIRIEVGRGIEDKITDADAGLIIRDSISPKLHVGDFDGGITDGVHAIENKLK